MPENLDDVIRVRAPLQDMWQHRGQTVTQWGRDRTNLVQYCFNSQGFRSTAEYDFIPRYAFFGCSITFGIGVAQTQSFAGLFDHSHNYGLAGDYTNADILDVLVQFLRTDIYSPDTKLCVVWSDRDQEHLPAMLVQLQEYPLEHFFCGTKPSGPRMWKFPPQIDTDVSGTHPGPLTHKFFYNVLCSIFNL